MLGATVGTIALASSGDASYAGQRLRQEWVPSFGSMWAIWTVSATTNYLVVPPRWSALFAMATAAVWNAYVSLRVHRPVLPTRGAGEHVGAYLREQRRFE